MTWSLSSYSATPGSNTAINGINIAEGCNASGINDAIRQLMADIAGAGIITSSGGTISSPLIVNATVAINSTLTMGSSANIEFDGAAGTDRGVKFRTAGSLRWWLDCNSTPEGGANTGSNLGIYGYSDAAGYLGEYIHIARNTGVVTLSAIPVFPTQTPGTGNTTAANTAYADAAVAVEKTRALAAEATTNTNLANAISSYNGDFTQMATYGGIFNTIMQEYNTGSFNPTQGSSYSGASVGGFSGTWLCTGVIALSAPFVAATFIRTV